MAAMKKPKYLGEYTCRGSHLGENEWVKIQLFDGRFDTAYKVVGFEICTRDVKTAANDVVAKLSISNAAIQDGGQWDWSDNMEIAWASQESRVSFGPSFRTSTIDKENLVVEDLWFTYGTVTTDDDPVNYIITLEKYEIGDTHGAVTMAKDKSSSPGIKWQA